MGEDASLLDLLFLGGALVLIILTAARIGRRDRSSKPAEGQRTATIGILIWLLLLGLAFYLMFG